MYIDSTIQDESYPLFLDEAHDLLHTIEQDLLALKGDRTLPRVHNLMRAAHTLKGAASSIGLETMKRIAHALEDVFKSLYNPEVVIDEELEFLLFQGYDCLYLCLQEASTHPPSADLQTQSSEDILNQVATIITQLQNKLGDFFDQEAALPTSEELGFDITQSIFEAGVRQRLNQLSQRLQSSEDVCQVETELRTHAEVFLGLAESLNLPGWGAIANATLTALDAKPEEAFDIARFALMDFEKGHAAVLAGDRTQGGNPSSSLRQFAFTTVEILQEELSELIEDMKFNADFQQEADLLATLGSDGVEISLEDVFNQAFHAGSEAAADFQQNGLLHHLDSRGDDRPAPASTPGGLDCSRGDQSENGLFQEDLFGELPLENPLDQSSHQEADEPSNFNLDQLFGNSDLSSGTIATRDKPADNPSRVPEQLFSNSDLPGGAIEPPEEPSEDSSLSLGQLFGNSDLPAGTIASPEAGGESGTELPKQPLSPDLDRSMLPPLVPSDLSAEEARFPGDAPLQQSPEDLEPLEVSVGRLLDTPPAPAPVPPSPLAVERFTEEPDLPQPQPKPAVAQAPSPAPQTMIRVSVEQLDKLNYLSGELLTNQNEQTAETERSRRLIREVLQLLQSHQQTLNTIQDWADQQRLGGNRGRRDAPNGGDRRSSPRSPLGVLHQFDALELDHYSELDTLIQSGLEERLQMETIAETLSLLIQQSHRSLEKQQRLLTGVRDDLTLARMQPLGEVLNRFHRVLQQLSAARQKPVRLILQGTDVLIERAIADKLYNPLLHLMRNAFDHGIESPEARQELGKPATGHIYIRAHQQGNRTVIEVQDDGKGLDFQRIRRRSVELNLLPPEQAAHLSEAQLVELLFEPGFSTASKLTDLSGRGVGLDVVLSQIRSLNGSVTVQSQLNQGTTFALHLPSSMSITQLMLCQANQTTYALTTDAIDQIVLPQPHQIHWLSGQKALFWQKGTTEYLIPIWKLSDLMPYATQRVHRPVLAAAGSQLSEQPLQRGDQPAPIVLLHYATQRLGLEVDQVLGEQELVIRPFNPTIPPPKYIYGTSILSNSQLALVIDPSPLIAEYSRCYMEGKEPPDAAQAVKSQSLPTFKLQSGSSALAPSPVQASSSPTVLVVDDSATIRQTLSKLLQRSGYQILQAMDGMEALEQLQKANGTQIGVICDLEMPRMNGFELLNQCRQTPALSQIPILVLTSRTGAKHRQLALELGASAYFTKPYAPEELLNQLNQFFQ